MHLASMKLGLGGQLRTIKEERTVAKYQHGEDPGTAADISSEPCWGSVNAKMSILSLPLHASPRKELKHTQVAG